MTICLIFLALIPTDWIFTAQLIYLIAIIGSAFNACGYYKAVNLSYGYFSSTIMSWFAIIYAIVILILPLGKTYIAGEDSPNQWRLFFYLAAGIALVTLIFWFYTADVKLRSWAVLQKKASIVSVMTYDTKDGGLFNLKSGYN
uniref:Uncharacterized protein n=1 Tax=Panagrolaimus davidi TaxID=227884 RepID=A0A914R3M2_9BILA